MPAQERTESATPRRRDEVRRRGQVARSAELSSAIALLTGAFFLRYYGDGIAMMLVGILRGSLMELKQPDLTVDSVMAATVGHLMILGPGLIPLFAVMMASGVAASLGQVGILFTVQPLQPSFGRINPLSGFKRLFTMRSLIELAKSLIKLVIVGYVSWRVIEGKIAQVMGLSTMPFPDSIMLVVTLLFDLAIWSGAVLLVVAALDYGYQRFSFEKEIRMSREEIKEEFKQTEGNPVIRQRVRQLQRAVAQRRMMQAVPRADVVITNPTHFAVALQYDAKTMRAPRVVAKGKDLIAEQIKRIAREHGVAMMENKPLAQALFKLCEVGDEVPADLYATIAELLAFVYRLRVGGGARPVPAATVT